MGLTPGGGPASGRIYSFGSPDVSMTWVLSADVAASLTAAVDANPAADGRPMDLGWDRPVSYQQIAALFAAELGKPVKIRHIPWPLLSVGMRVLGAIDSRSEEAARCSRSSRPADSSPTPRLMSSSSALCPPPRTPSAVGYARRS